MAVMKVLSGDGRSTEVVGVDMSVGAGVDAWSVGFPGHCAELLGVSLHCLILI